MNRSVSAQARTEPVSSWVPKPVRSLFTHQSALLSLLALLLVAAALAWWLNRWAQLGLGFYERVLPFYDSLSYQAAFTDAARLNHEFGPWRAVGRVWSEPHNNVVLYKLFSAATAEIGRAHV